MDLVFREVSSTPPVGFAGLHVLLLFPGIDVPGPSQPAAAACRMLSMIPAGENDGCRLAVSLARRRVIPAHPLQHFP
jgi:hypothetical protein